MGKFVLIIGSTSGIGLFTTQMLLKSGYQVRVITRSLDKLQQIYGDLNQFEKVIHLDVLSEIEKFVNGEIENPLCKLFEPNPKYGKPSMVIQAMGSYLKSKRAVELIDYKFNEILINQSKQHNIERFILVTSQYMTRSYSPIVFLLNSLVPMCFGWKAKSENHLRQSGLNYTIVRPGGLIGNKDGTQQPHLCGIDQGDLRPSGLLNRATVAQVIVDSLDANICNKVTFELFTENSNQKKQEYQTPNFKKLTQDDHQSFVQVDHFKSYAIIKNTMIYVTLSIVIGLLVAIYK